jgi:hypothetical protein
MMQTNVRSQLTEVVGSEQERARKAARLFPVQWHQARNPRHEDLPMFVRHCPFGADRIGIWQPHGSNGYWRIYWGCLPVVRHHHDLGCFETALDAICAADEMLAHDMKNVLLD